MVPGDGGVRILAFHAGKNCFNWMAFCSRAAFSLGPTSTGPALPSARFGHGAINRLSDVGLPVEPTVLDPGTD